MSAPAIPISRGKLSHDETTIIATGGGQNKSDIAHNGWKMVRQMKSIKEISLGTIVGVIAIIISVGAVVGRQGETNGTYAKAIDNLTAAQKDNKEESARLLTEAVARIEAGMKQSHDDLRDLKESNERKITALELKLDSTWNWMVELKNRLGMMEIDNRKSKETK